MATTNKIDDSTSDIKALSSCSVCGKTDVKLSKCSRCKADDYRVCGKACQAKDWKRHKRKDCYVYDAILHQQAPKALREFKNKECPICLEAFTERNVLQCQIQLFPCRHGIHVECSKRLGQQDEVSYALGSRDKETLFKCPLCRSFVGNMAKLIPWYEEDASELLHKALGFAFQAHNGGNGTVQEEINFIQSHLTDTIRCGQMEMVLSQVKAAQELFRDMLPELRAIETMDERRQRVMTVEVKVNLAVGCVFLPGTLEGQDDLIRTEQEKWTPHMHDWVDTLQLYGPYRW